jgi:regulatory protein
MPRITAITTSRKDPQRASIKVDGKAVATLSFTWLDDLGIAVDQAWDEALAQRVAAAAMYDKALRAALRRIDRRAMSTRQLADKLRSLGFEQAIIESVTAQLTQRGLLDDKAFGEALIREVHRGKPAGPRLLRAKLRQKGLESQLIDQLLEADAAADLVDIDVDALAGENPSAVSTTTARAIKLVRQKLPSLMRFDAITRKRRLWGLLARRGFDGETIEHALKMMNEE